METDTFGQPTCDREFLSRIHKLEFRRAVQKGLDSLERKDRMPLDEARRLLLLWVSKYSSDGSSPPYGSNLSSSLYNYPDSGKCLQIYDEPYTPPCQPAWVLD